MGLLFWQLTITCSCVCWPVGWPGRWVTFSARVSIAGQGLAKFAVGAGGVVWIYSRLSLSRSRKDPLKHFEISVLRHIRFGKLRKIPMEQPNFTNEHLI